MELKVRVGGVLRTVCGLSPATSCQEVVITLAQAIGQTGRYSLTMRCRGNEQTLVAEDRPVQKLVQLGPLAAEVQFFLRRIGPSLSEGLHAPAKRVRGFPLPPASSEPELRARMGPHKALTFNLGPLTLPRRSKPRRDFFPSPVSSPEPTRPDSADGSVGPHPAKEEAVLQALEQQRRLQELELQIWALEKETILWEQERRSAAALDFSLSPALTEELAELEQQLRQNQAELRRADSWEEDLQVEEELERAMSRRLEEINASFNEQNDEILELRSRQQALEQQLEAQRQKQIQSSQAELQQKSEVLHSLTQKLQRREQLGDELQAMLTESQSELQAVELRVKERQEMMEELSKELRQSDLQDFIQQAGVNPYPDPYGTSVLDDMYLRSSGIME